MYADNMETECVDHNDAFRSARTRTGTMRTLPRREMRCVSKTESGPRRGQACRTRDAERTAALTRYTEAHIMLYVQKLKH